MTGTNEDLVGKIWTTGRPQEPDSPINALPLKFAGTMDASLTVLRLLSKSRILKERLLTLIDKVQ